MWWTALQGCQATTASPISGERRKSFPSHHFPRQLTGVPSCCGVTSTTEHDLQFLCVWENRACKSITRLLFQANFQAKKSIDGCNTIMSYLELCRVGELSSTADASPLAFEVFPATTSHGTKDGHALDIHTGQGIAPKLPRVCAHVATLTSGNRSAFDCSVEHCCCLCCTQSTPVVSKSDRKRSHTSISLYVYGCCLFLLRVAP